MKSNLFLGGLGRFGASLSFGASVLALAAATAGAQPAWHPGHYMLVTLGDSRVQANLDGRIAEIAAEPNIKGVKARWFWGDIESDAGGQYDWSAVEHALHQCALAGRYLVVGIQDRNFGGGTTVAHAKAALPDYLVDTYGYYTIGSGTGVAARIYLPAVTDRYIAMMQDMARHFANHPDLPHLEAVYSGETAPGNPSPGSDYNAAEYVKQRMRAGAAMVSFWPHTNVIQGFNFIPGDDFAGFMQHIDRQRLATGGPDVFHAQGDGLTPAQEELIGITGNVDYRGKVPVMFDIQGADFDFDRGDGVNPTLPADLFKVAYQQLRSSHIFWARFTTGTSAQNWSTGILPFVNSIGGLTHPEKPINYGGGLPRVVECEAFDLTGSPSAVERRTAPRDVLFHATNVGDTIVFRVPNLPAGSYNIDAVVQKGPDRGRFQLESDTAIDGAYAATHGTAQETYDAAYLSGQTLTVATGVNIPSTGTRFFRFRVTGKTGSGYQLGLDRLTLTATGAPKIVVKGRATSIADGDTTPGVSDDTDFGSADFHLGDVEKIYTIENIGSAPLIVGSVLAGGDIDYRDFGVLVRPPFSVAAGASTTFTIAFTPQGINRRTATVRLLNNDTTASHFDFAVKGRGVDGPDTVAPVLSSLTASPNVLWPPNGKLVSVTIAVALSDNMDPAPTARIVSVTCSEAAGNPFFEIAGNLTLKLRAERSGSGPGRIYSVQVEASDASGNVTLANVYVTVPHDKGRDRTAPAVAILSPAAGGGVTGATTLISADAFDDVAVAGVQFKLDGANLGAERTVASYTITWDTTTMPDGPRVLTAVARDTSGNLTVSSPVEVEVVNPPAAPAGLGATAESATQVSLAWTDGSDNETQFRIERRTNGGAYAFVATAPMDAVGFNDTAGTPGSAYTYRVRAENAVGASVWSNESSVTTPGPLTVEFETATIAANTRPYTIRSNPSDVLFQSNADDAYITFAVPEVSAGNYAITVRLQVGPNRGKFQLESSTALDGTYAPHGVEQDTYGSGFASQTRTVTSDTTLAESGPRYFRFRATGKNSASTNRYLALDRMTLTPLMP